MRLAELNTTEIHQMSTTGFLSGKNMKYWVLVFNCLPIILFTQPPTRPRLGRRTKWMALLRMLFAAARDLFQHQSATDLFAVLLFVPRMETSTKFILLGHHMG
jgi:hypothetical protein